jgi:hypothetical protein
MPPEGCRSLEYAEVERIKKNKDKCDLISIGSKLFFNVPQYKLTKNSV